MAIDRVPLFSSIGSSPAYLWSQCIVIWGLTGQEDVCESIFFAYNNVSKPTVAFILTHAVPESLIEDVTLFTLQFPFHSGVKIQASIGKRGTFQKAKGK